MAQNKTGAELWQERRDRLIASSSPKRGPHNEIRQKLMETLTTAQKLSLLGKITPIGNYERKVETWLDGRKMIVEFQVNFTNGNLQVAFRSESEDISKTRYYSITSNGVAVDLSETTSVPVEKEWPHLAKCLSKAKDMLEKDINSKLYQKSETRRRIKKTALTLGILLVIATLVFFGLRWWMFEPQEATQRARNDFDSIGRQLEIQAYPLDSHSLGLLSERTLDSIPAFGGDDKSLAHPRTVELSYNSTPSWCKTLSVDIPANSALGVGVADNSPFGKDQYVATFSGGKLTLCLVNGFSASSASKTINVKVALQARPQGLAN